MAPNSSGFHSIWPLHGKDSKNSRNSKNAVPDCWLAAWMAEWFSLAGVWSRVLWETGFYRFFLAVVPFKNRLNSVCVLFK